MKRTSLPWSTLFTYGDSANKQFWPASGWVSAADVVRVRGTFEQRASQALFRATFAYQVADAASSPGTVYELGTALTADGFNYGTLTGVSANTDAKQLVRFGWYVWYHTAGAAGLTARCGGLVEYDNC